MSDGERVFSESDLDEVHRLLFRMPKQLNWWKTVSEGFEPPLAPPEFYLLRMVERHHLEGKAARISDLAHVMGTSAAAVTNLVTALERGDYVRRLRSENDRRVVHVTLTDKGRNALERLGRNRRRMLDELLADLGEHDSRELIRLLNRVQDFFERYREREAVPATAARQGHR